MKPKDTFWKKLTPLVFPIAFQQLMSALVSTSDTLMMGLIDQSSLSAVSLATQITFVAGLFAFGLTGAGSLLAAQYWGKGSREEVEQVFAVMLRPMVMPTPQTRLLAVRIKPCFQYSRAREHFPKR